MKAISFFGCKTTWNLGTAWWLLTAMAQTGQGADQPQAGAPVVASSQPGSGQLLNIDFGKSPLAVPKTGRAAIGLSDQDSWNTFPSAWQNEVHVAQLKWSDGAPSSIGYDLLNGPGNWGSNLVSDSMYADYVYSSDNVTITLVVTNLPTGTYNLYVYAHGVEDNQNTAVRLSTGNWNLGPFSTVNGPEWRSLGWQEGSQYVVFRAFSVEPGQKLTLTLSSASANMAVLNGLQILRVAQVVRPPRLLDIDFGKNNATPPKKGKAATGLTDQDYWNSFENPFQYEVHIENLKWSDGTASPVGYDLLNSPGMFGSDFVSDSMYADYTYVDSANISLVLRQLPADTYDFYLYSHGAADNQNSAFRLTVGSQNLGPLATVNGPSWTSSTWQEGGQYVVFRRVRVLTNQEVTIAVAPASSSYAVLNGIQVQRAVVPLPDPNDGISAVWREDYFGSSWAIDPDAVGSADPDGDGATNLEEFQAGTNPLDANSILYITQLRMVPLVTWASVSNRLYQVVRKTSPEVTEWTPLLPVVRATNSVTGFVDVSATNDHALYRVKPLP